jgi:hypothetical protein
MTQFNCIESTHNHNMTEWAPFPTTNQALRDPNRLLNHGHHHEQIK